MISSKKIVSFSAVFIAVCCFNAVTGMELEPVLCMDTCSELTEGDFQSCRGCDGFVTCIGGVLYERDCVGGQVWDDSFKRCMNESTTCTQESLPGVDACVTDCTGKDNGNYKSCNGCNIYATCLHGNLIDNRPCPGGLVFSSQKQTCDYRANVPEC